MTPGAGIRQRRGIRLNARAALGLLACALTALVYQAAFELPFVFDDRATVLLNPALVRAWDLRAIVSADLPGAAVTWSYPCPRPPRPR